MKVTIEIPNEFVADMVVKALLDEAYRFEKRRDYYRTEYERTQQRDMRPSLKQAELTRLAETGAKQKIVSDQLADLADAIYGQVFGEPLT